jgi:putative pyruvate formate lyase activating enzyme
VLCQNHDISWQLQGERTGPQRLAEMMLELQTIGCHNIKWVTPEHAVPQILEALPLAVDGGLRLPIVYNRSAYDSPDSLALMDGVVKLAQDLGLRRLDERSRTALPRLAAATC